MNVIYRICDGEFFYWKKLETVQFFRYSNFVPETCLLLSKDKNNSNMEERFYMAEYFSYIS